LAGGGGGEDRVDDIDVVLAGAGGILTGGGTLAGDGVDGAAAAVFTGVVDTACFAATTDAGMGPFGGVAITEVVVAVFAELVVVGSDTFAVEELTLEVTIEGGTFAGAIVLLGAAIGGGAFAGEGAAVLVASVDDDEVVARLGLAGATGGGGPPAALLDANDVDVTNFFNDVDGTYEHIRSCITCLYNDKI
jgi:hypothetical protein